MLAIVVPTIAATFAFAWWFRASHERARYLPDWVFSGRIELIVWSIPLLSVILLGGVAWIGSHDLDPAKPLTSNTPPLEVQGVSQDRHPADQARAQHLPPRRTQAGHARLHCGDASRMINRSMMPRSGTQTNYLIPGGRDSGRPHSA
jgi:hypothetical protein